MMSKPIHRRAHNATFRTVHNAKNAVLCINLVLIFLLILQV